MTEQTTPKEGWRDEAIAEIAYAIDKNCTGGTNEDFVAAKQSVRALVPKVLVPASHLARAEAVLRRIEQHDWTEAPAEMPDEMARAYFQSPTTQEDTDG
jgi:hypothetical protein